jgi:hypothetical protein
MKPNLKVILSAAAGVTLLASPVMASNARHHSAVRHSTAHARAYVPGSAYGFVGPNPTYVPNNAYGFAGSYAPARGDTLSERWRATHPYSWDANHDPRENPQF